MTFDYQLQQKVRLIEIDRPGIIDAIGIFRDGVQYRVAFWCDGKREIEWVYPSEIESI